MSCKRGSFTRLNRRDRILVWSIDNHDNFDLLVGLPEHAVDRAQQQFRPIEGRYYDRDQHPQFSKSPGARGTSFARTTISVILTQCKIQLSRSVLAGQALYTSRGRVLLPNNTLTLIGVHARPVDHFSGRAAEYNFVYSRL